MIKIQTVESKIIWSDGTTPTGQLVIAPVDSFIYTETDGKRKIVSLDEVEVDFVNGVLMDTSASPPVPTTFDIAPTIGAGQNKSALYYVATYYIGNSQYTEYWAIDAVGASILELANIAKVVPDETGAAILIIQNGRLYISQYEPTTDPADSDIAQWRQIDGSGNTVQIYDWAGSSARWRMVA